MTQTRVARFGPFTFDPASGELRRDGRRVPLQRQPGRLLELLIATPGEVVTRERIRQALWGDQVHVDFERSLNFCVARLRSALGDDAAAPRFVETVPTRGYRFIAATEATEATADTEKAGTEYTEDTESTERSSGADTEDTESTKRPPNVGLVFRHGLRMWTVVIALLLVAAGLAVAVHRSEQVLPRVVVVPFHNETGSADFDRVAKGVSDAAVARLAAPDRLLRLRVIGNATDVFFSFRPRDMKAMGQALGAQYLLLGQVKKDDRRTRVIAHLIRVSDQTHVWANTFDRERLDLDAQAEVAERIAAAVSSTIPRG